MTDIRKHYVAIDGGRQVHYYHRPGERDPIVCLHQTASSGRMFLDCFGHLDGWDCYAFDTPGFGGSFDPPADTSPSMADYVDWLGAAIGAAGIERCHLVGHHTGACIAVQLAADRPALARSLTLVGPVMLTADERKTFSQSFGTPFTPTVSGSYLLENWEYLRALGADRDIALLHREMADMLRAWQGRVQAYAAVWDQDFPAMFERVQCPIQAMAAADDVLFPYLDRAKAARPETRIVDIAGANFEPDLDSTTFAAALNDFCGAAT